jgi:hypothetical protein
MTEQVKTITVDGTEYQLDSFPKEIQQLVGIHQRWEAKLVDSRLDLALVEAGIRDLTRELSGKIKEYLDAQTTAAGEPAEGEVSPVEASNDAQPSA